MILWHKFAVVCTFHAASDIECMMSCHHTCALSTFFSFEGAFRLLNILKVLLNMYMQTKGFLNKP